MRMTRDLFPFLPIMTQTQEDAHGDGCGDDGVSGGGGGGGDDGNCIDQ